MMAGAIAAKFERSGGMIASVFSCKTIALTKPYRSEPSITPTGRQAPK